MLLGENINVNIASSEKKQTNKQTKEKEKKSTTGAKMLWKCF